VLTAAAPPIPLKGIAASVDVGWMATYLPVKSDNFKLTDAGGARRHPPSIAISAKPGNAGPISLGR